MNDKVDRGQFTIHNSQFKNSQFTNLQFTINNSTLAHRFHLLATTTFNLLPGINL
jgi:hypothetical protein